MRLNSEIKAFKEANSLSTAIGIKVIESPLFSLTSLRILDQTFCFAFLVKSS